MTVKQFLKNVNDFRHGRYWPCVAMHIAHEREFLLRDDGVPAEWLCIRHLEQEWRRT